MPPPPTTARILRPPKLISLDLAGAWVRREVEHIAARKAQDVRQMANHLKIDQDAHKAELATRTAKALRQRALDALDAGDAAAVKHALLALGKSLDESAERLADVRGHVVVGMAIEGEDVQGNVAQTHEANIKIRQISAVRRGQPDPSGPEAS